MHHDAFTQWYRISRNDEFHRSDYDYIFADWKIENVKSGKTVSTNQKSTIKANPTAFLAMYGLPVSHQKLVAHLEYNQYIGWLIEYYVRLLASSKVVVFF
jgi:hypothetical protein